MNSDDDLEIPAFLKRPPGPPVDLKRLMGETKTTRGLNQPTETDKVVGDSIMDELTKKGLATRVDYVPSYLSRARIKVTIETGGNSSHGATRWLGNVIAEHPGYSLESNREMQESVEYTIRCRDV